MGSRGDSKIAALGRKALAGAAAGAILLAVTGLPDAEPFLDGPQQAFSPAERQTIASLSLANLPPLPADPTNRFADDPGAAALGATLFFDQRLSANGKVACATCHKIDRQFQDDLPLGEGLGTANRRTMPLAGAAWKSWFFWDGRKDSLWSQALAPLEKPAEHAGNRTAYAHFMAKNFGPRYARIFGPMPDLSRLPADAGPLGTPAEQAAWGAMSEADQRGVDRIFANMGKAIEAFERALPYPQTRFDRFAAALAAGQAPAPADAFSAEETLGLKLFVGRANCVTCHNGPRFSDGGFHNTGIPVGAGLPPDLGRETGIKEVSADRFNCLGPFSDGNAASCTALATLAGQGTRLTRAYKTPSLRGVAGRPPYMHAGRCQRWRPCSITIPAPRASSGGASEVKPLNLTEEERKALVAFLQTLD